jgi:hypothetical protein
MADAELPAVESGYTITTADGHRFHAVIERIQPHVGVAGKSKNHWVFYDPDVRHVGPAWAPLQDVAELQQIVNTRWRSALGQAPAI